MPELRMRILHVITDLSGVGGTETTLFRYLCKAGGAPAEHKVVVLRDIGGPGSIGARIMESGISVTALGQGKGKMTLSGLFTLFRIAQEFRPDVISAWLYHPCLLAAVVRIFLPFKCRLVWNIRSLLFCNFRQHPGRYLVQRALGVIRPFSRPNLATNSPMVVSDHRAIGFPGDAAAWSVIPNGLDTTVFQPDRDSRSRVRFVLGIPQDALVIGCVGRFVPEKGYRYFFEALRMVLLQLEPAIAARVHLVAVGNGVSVDNAAFVALSESTLPEERMHFLGKRTDIPELLRAMDIFVLPSISEAFPNALLEAMATGVACVATDVGGCREAMSDSELLVMPGNPAALSKAIVLLLHESPEQREARGTRNRSRVEANYSLAQMRVRFDALFGIEAAAQVAAIS